MSQQSSLEQWATWAFSPTWSAILVTFLVALSLPVILHYYLYRQAAAKEAPTFLLVGSSGAGKTSLLTLFSSGTPSATHTSSTPSSALCSLPRNIKAKSAQYRSEHDAANATPPSFVLLDTPGHGKLRHHALSSLSSPTALKGLVFVVDSAAISSSDGLTETAEYLHDVLLVLQKRANNPKGKGSGLCVLIAANKQDVFTSLPPKLVQQRLEEEISKVRVTRSKGLLDSGIGMEEDGTAAEGDEEGNWLGEFGSRKFGFGQMEEYGLEVQVEGGNVVGSKGEGGKVEEWWKWVAQQL